MLFCRDRVKLQKLGIDGAEKYLKKLTHTQLCMICVDFSIPFSSSNKKDVLIAKILKNVFSIPVTIPKNKKRNERCVLHLTCVSMIDRKVHNHKRYRHIFVDDNKVLYIWDTYKNFGILNKKLCVKATTQINQGMIMLSKVNILKEFNIVDVK